MTDAQTAHGLAQTGNVATATPDTMAWDSRARRVMMIYLPLSCFVLILLFPFYWMALTSFKPNAELLNYKENLVTLKIELEEEILKHLGGVLRRGVDLLLDPV